MGDWSYNFCFPDVAENDAKEFRTFMSAELIKRKVILPDLRDCTYDPDWVDFEAHSPGPFFRDTILKMDRDHYLWYDDEDGLKFYPPYGEFEGYYPTYGIGLCAGRWVSLLAMVTYQKMRCPKCGCDHTPQEGNDNTWRRAFDGLYNFMDKEIDRFQIQCDDCLSNSENDQWKLNDDLTITMSTFFHISVWNWFGSFGVDQPVSDFRSLLQDISGQRILFTDYKL